MRKNILPILILTGCSSIKTPDYKIIDPRESISIENYNSDSFKLQTKIIKLETANKSLVGDIRSISVTNDKIFVFDKYLNNIKVFTIEGDFVDLLINDEGDKNDFWGCTDICLSPDDDSLAILDGPRRKILIFDSQTLAFLTSFDIDHQPMKLLWTKNGFVLFSPYPYNYFNNGFKLSVVSIKGDLINRVDKQNLNKGDLEVKTSYNTLFETERGIGYWDISESVIFEFAADKFKSILGFNNSFFPNHSKKVFLSEEKMTESIKNDFLFTRVFFHSPFFFFTGYLQKNRITCLYDTESRNLYNANFGLSNNPFNLGIGGGKEFPYPFWPDGKTSNGKYLYQSVDPYSLSQFLSQRDNKLTNSEYKADSELYENPIIVLKW